MAGSTLVIGMQRCSNGWCSGNVVVVEMSCCATSWAVSEAVQKNAHDSHQPIWRLVGTTIWKGSLDMEGRIYAKFHASSG